MSQWQASPTKAAFQGDLTAVSAGQIRVLTYQCAELTYRKDRAIEQWLSPSNKYPMGCASGKKMTSSCRPLPCSSGSPVLQLQAAHSPSVEAIAPVSLLLMTGKEARPKVERQGLPPKKPLTGSREDLLLAPKSPVLGKAQNCVVPASPPLAVSPSAPELSLSSARNIVGSKEAFDKSKYQEANMTSATETGLGPVFKPPSSLSLIRPQAPLFTGSGKPVLVRPVKALEGTAGSTLVSDFR